MSPKDQFTAEPVLSGLTGFQRDTVEHVVRQFYGKGNGKRFLVADETGLGKTMVARGVIARAIEELEYTDTVKRIDIVYVCSNFDIAQQNLNALDVTGEDYHRFASRLTLLAKHSRHLKPFGRKFTKPVNLISFTPGTSFETGWQTGKSEERAMLYLLLEGQLGPHRRRCTAAKRLLQGQVAKLSTFEATIEYLRHEMRGDIDPSVKRAFLAAARQQKLLARFDALVDEMGQRRAVPPPLRDGTRELIGAMRSALAMASVGLLEPDLVILDEFQRFRQLLDPTQETGALAHSLFDYPDARVLLLSATPYKPFTYAEEATAGDSHQANFMETIQFLAAPLQEPVVEAVSSGLSRYREAIVTKAPVDDIRCEVRNQLLKVMTRTERPRFVAETMGKEILKPNADLPAADLLDFVTIRELSRLVDAPFLVEYWKSAPYFVNFMDGYKIGEKVRLALNQPGSAERVSQLLAMTQSLNADAMRRLEPVDMGNAKLRTLATETVGTGWWKLLWVPPSLHYLEPDGPYAEPFAQQVTKRLVFSSWAATPTAIAALLSHEATRRVVAASGEVDRNPEARRALRSRLSYRTDSEGRPQRMTSLAIFWPMPGLAALADPRAYARRIGGPATSQNLAAHVAALLGVDLDSRTVVRGTSGEAAYWVEAMRRPDSRPELTEDDIVAAMGGRDDDSDPESEADSQGNLALHVSEALKADERHNEPVTEDLAAVLAELAAHSPGNISYRALSRVAAGSSVTPEGLWKAAARLASALRALFARPETILLIEQFTRPGLPYWRGILAYCAYGNLQAAMDEYVHQLAHAERTTAIDDSVLERLVGRAVEAISLRPATYDAFDPDDPDKPMKLTARFALRYGGRKQLQESVRQPQVRAAFNSPFNPFVLATTSVGQEGIDFHWWSHSLLHWNTPANPVDFEQREGRIDRYGCHAVRKNLAARHLNQILASEDDDPWTAAYRLGLDERGRLGEFAPYWVYPGPVRIERHVTPYALSTDELRLARIKKDVAMYRLTFGQPRQEDMLSLLQRQYEDADPSVLATLRIDLSPPRRA